MEAVHSDGAMTVCAAISKGRVCFNIKGACAEISNDRVCCHLRARKGGQQRFAGSFSA